MNTFERRLSPEKETGKNVSIVYKLIRHGERTPEGALTDYGREVTRERAQESEWPEQHLDAVKAYGSQAGPKNKEGFGRSLETAHIFAEEVVGPENEHSEGGKQKKRFKSRPEPRMSFESVKTTAPYNHTQIYNSNLPENFNDLSDQGKVIAAAKAQSATVNYLFSLNTPEALAYKKEVAGAFASDILHFERMMNKLKDDSTVLLPHGTHGPMPELFLQQALVRKMSNGDIIKGFEDIDEIGGPLNPSESFNFFIESDEQGKSKRIRIEFESPDRPKAEEMYLDHDKLEELAQLYEELHKADKR
jgi:hypothetical protein